MRIRICDIRPEGIEVKDQIPKEFIELKPDEYINFIAPLEVTAKIEKIETTVLAKVHVKSRFKSFCARSLVPVEKDWSQDFLLDFEIDDMTEYIDLDEDIRQEVILALPMRVLSDEEEQLEKIEELKQSRIPEATQKEAKTHKPFANLKDVD